MTKGNEAITRCASFEDVPRLKALWKTAFGDEDADIHHFYDTWFSPELTVVINDADAVNDRCIPVSAAYILPVGALVLPGGVRLPCAMLYAIATLPRYRGRGYGEAVTRAAAEQATATGFPAVVLKPADEGLFDFYEKRTDFRTFFDVCEVEYSAHDLSAASSSGYPADECQYALTRVAPAEYRRIRQSLLKGCVHIDTDEGAFSYQQYLCQKSGGGLYMLVRGGDKAGCTGAAAGCAVIEPAENSAGSVTVQIKELLLSPGCGVKDAVSAVSRLVKAGRYIVRILPEYGGKKSRRFAMMVPLEGCPNVSYSNSAKWYGPAFD